MGYIYIMTNPAYQGYVKIGSTRKTVEQRRSELSHPEGVMFPFEVYAYYVSANDIDDITLHDMIDTINPSLRVNKRREFYKMSPHEAYKLLEAIAKITGTVENLTLINDEQIADSLESKQNKRPKFSFVSAGIPVGADLVFTQNKEIVAKYIGGTKAKNIEYRGNKYSLSSLAQELLGTTQQLQGTLYFEYNGENLNRRRIRMEEEGSYKQE